MYTATHFIPLMGSFVISNEEYFKKEIKNKYFFSFDAFKTNEEQMTYNYPKYDIKYFSHFRTINQYRKYIAKNNISSTDLVFSIPPCAGLTRMNNSNRGFEHGANDYIYEAVKFFIAQDSKVLILENSSSLVGSEGLKVLDKILELIKEDNYLNKYKINIIKVNTENHGIPQKRLRCFFVMYKAKEFNIFKHYEKEKITIEEFLERNTYDSKYNINISGSKNKDFLKMGIKYGLIDKFYKDNKEEKKCKGNLSYYLYDLYEKDKSIFDKYDDKIKKFMEHIYYKKKIKKGFWEMSPSIIKGRMNVVNSKSLYCTIHPILKNRFLYIREMMSIMGLPKSFKIKNFDKIKESRKFNFLCQAVPVSTCAASTEWLLDILENKLEKMKPEKEVSILIQDNYNCNMEKKYKIYK